jgi:hypothetical protein
MPSSNPVGHVTLKNANPIPKRWRPVELKKPQPKVDLAPYFSDWEHCPDCEKGVITTREEKNGYAIRKRKQCERCGGQGGWHKRKEAV